MDADEPAAAARLEAIRDCLRRGLSPEQMAARNGGPVDLSVFDSLEVAGLSVGKFRA